MRVTNTSSSSTTPPSAPSEVIASLTKENVELRSQVSTLTQQVEWFKKQLFGPKSEKRPDKFPDLQLSLFTPEQLQVAATNTPLPVSKVEVPAHERKLRVSKTAIPDNAGVSGLRFDSSVEIQEVECPNPAIEGLSADEYDVLGEEIVDKLCQRRSSYYVKRYRRIKVKLKNDAGDIVTSPAVPSVLPGSFADVSFLVGMIVDKILFHIPLYRTHQRLTDGGIFIARGTLTNYLHAVADLLQPIFQILLESILRSKIVTMDETWMKAGVDSESQKMSQGYIWSLFGDQDEVALQFFDSREHEIVDTILGDSFSGVLLSDDYEAYTKYAAKSPNITHALCWSHARRKFIDSEKVEPQRSAEALAQFGALYKIEKIIRETNITGSEKLEYRSKFATKIVDGFFSWMKTQAQDTILLPTSPFTKAIAYSLDNEKEMRCFLTNPDVPLDTNHLERAHKLVAIGRRNYLFCFTEAGAECLAILYSLLYTARLQKIDPKEYLTDVLLRIRDCPTKDLYSLTPRGWKDAKLTGTTPVDST